VAAESLSVADIAYTAGPEGSTAEQDNISNQNFQKFGTTKHRYEHFFVVASVYKRLEIWGVQILEFLFSVENT
jgi:hypothetical protein